MVLSGVAVVAPSAAGIPLARRLAQMLPGASLHLPGEWAGSVSAHLCRLFAAGTPIVGVCSAGILVRALGPAVSDKQAEPPVVAVAADGSVAVPLLGGHHGANALAREIAAAVGGVAAVTTASDGLLGLALDEPPAGWRLGGHAALKPVTAALLAGAPVALTVEAGEPGWLQSLPFVTGAAPVSVLVTDRDAEASGERLLLHPPTLALGVGCERGTPPEELEDLALTTLAQAGLSPLSVACVASLDLKADEEAVHALARALDVPARFFSAAELEAEAPRLATPSEVVFQETGCHGVAEGAALAAAGPAAVLAVPKRKGRRSTCAIARVAAGFTPAGRPRGRLFVVGIGPGSDRLRTPEAARAIAAAEDLVGYSLYLDLLDGAADGKTRHDSPIGAEIDRARLALDLAAQGRAVALVCSGDAGIYALATLVFELLDQHDRADWNRVEIQVCPGISAFQTAAARAGAPVNHDFCCISLSDLLTPWPVIERRVRAAAEADFVVAFYNPVSRKRRDQLERARNLLLAARPGATPVILARNLGREGETVQVIRLDSLSADQVDMLTLVLVGSSQSRVIERGGRSWVYTPRGYAV